MTISISRLVPRERPAASVRLPDRARTLLHEVDRRMDESWILPLLATALCIVVAASLFAHGFAAAVWFALGIAVFLGGAPICLIVAHLRVRDPRDRS